MISFKTVSLTKSALVAVAAFGLSQPVLADNVAISVVAQDVGVDPVAMELAAQIIDTGFPEETREELFFGTMDQMIVQLRVALEPMLPADDQGAVEIFDEWLVEHTEESKGVLRKHIPAIMRGMALSYANVFSVEELTDILAFVETPSGKRYFALSPSILSDRAFADANQAYMDETVELVLPAQERLRERLDAYLEDRAANDPEPDA